jgi:hypothetical protein
VIEEAAIRFTVSLYLTFVWFLSILTTPNLAIQQDADDEKKHSIS